MFKIMDARPKTEKPDRGSGSELKFSATTKCPKHPESEVHWLKQSDVLSGGADFSFEKPFCTEESPHGLSPNWLKVLRVALDTCQLPADIRIEAVRKQPESSLLPAGTIELAPSSLRKLYLSSTTREGLERIRRRIAHGPTAYKRHGLDALTDLRLNAIFFGPPGTGKTSGFLEVTAGLVERRVSVSLRSLVGSHLGDTERNLQDLAAFVAASSNQPGRLSVLLDDADDFMSSRGNDTSAAGQTLNALKVGMLKLLDSAGAVTIVLTTNRLMALDGAIHRRIVEHVEFPLPDETARCEMIHGFLKEIRNTPVQSTLEEEAILVAESAGLAPAEIALSVVDALIEYSPETNSSLTEAVLSGFRYRKSSKSKWAA